MSWLECRAASHGVLTRRCLRLPLALPLALLPTVTLALPLALALTWPLALTSAPSFVPTAPAR